MDMPITILKYSKYDLEFWCFVLVAKIQGQIQYLEYWIYTATQEHNGLKMQ